MSMIRPEDFRYRQEAEQCARKLRIEQVKQHIARLQTHVRHATDAEQAQEVIAMLTRVNAYLAALQTPRRSSTFPDLRNTMGSE
jgi:DNA primase